MGFVVLGVLEKNLVHVGARILIQLVARAEDNQRDLAVAEHGQLVRLLHHSEFPFVEGHLTIPFVRDARNLNLLPTHFCTTLRRRDSSSEPLDGILKTLFIACRSQCRGSELHTRRWSIFTGLSAAPTELFRAIISHSTLLRPRCGRAKKKGRRESEFDQKHNFRDVIGGRACAVRIRCFSIYRGNTCAFVGCFFFRPPFLFPTGFSYIFLSSDTERHYIAMKHATLS